MLALFLLAFFIMPYASQGGQCTSAGPHFLSQPTFYDCSITKFIQTSFQDFLSWSFDWGMWWWFVLIALAILGVTALLGFGKEAEFYGTWDDFAGQDGLMISPEIFKRYFFQRNIPVSGLLYNIIEAKLIRIRITIIKAAKRK